MIAVAKREAIIVGAGNGNEAISAACRRWVCPPTAGFFQPVLRDAAQHIGFCAIERKEVRIHAYASRVVIEAVGWRAAD